MLLRAIPPVAVSALCLALAPGVRQSFSPAAPGTAATPLPSSGVLPTQDEFDALARTRPVAMLEAAHRRAEKELKGYRAVMVKQERMGGKLFDPETISVACRIEPFAVMMKWTAGFRVMVSEVKATRYDAGAKSPLLVYRPKAIFKELAADPRGGDAQQSSRVGIEEFGVSHAVRRTWQAWADADKRGELTTEYLGVKSHADAGNRPCHVVRRTCREPQIDPFVAGTPTEPGTQPVKVTDANRADAFDTVTVWIDRETWEQVGTEQHRGKELVARYFFRITDRNPTFDKDEFSPAALRK